MAVMSIGKTNPPVQPLTVDDLERMPDDGKRYELVDGRLDVTPAPAYPHIRAEHRLGFLLELAATDDFEVAGTPGINFNGDRTHHRIPDLAVTRAEDVEFPVWSRAPVLAVEVLSPSSALRDSETKRREYAEFGIESYWIVNPALDKPGISELRLDGQHYTEVRQVHGEDLFQTDFPFPTKFVPAWLIASGPWKRRIGGE